MLILKKHFLVLRIFFKIQKDSKKTSFVLHCPRSPSWPAKSRGPGSQTSLPFSLSLHHKELWEAPPTLIKEEERTGTRVSVTVRMFLV